MTNNPLEKNRDEVTKTIKIGPSMENFSFLPKPSKDLFSLAS